MQSALPGALIQNAYPTRNPDGCTYAHIQEHRENKPDSCPLRQERATFRHKTAIAPDRFDTSVSRQHPAIHWYIAC